MRCKILYADVACSASTKRKRERRRESIKPIAKRCPSLLCVCVLLASAVLVVIDTHTRTTPKPTCNIMSHSSDAALFKQRIARHSDEKPINELELETKDVASSCSSPDLLHPAFASDTSRSWASSPEPGSTSASPSRSSPVPVVFGHQRLQQHRPFAMVPELTIHPSGPFEAPELDCQLYSPIAGVRPQWTPRTSAGRAKLMTESYKWEQAETVRELKKSHQQAVSERSQMRKMSNADEAALRREATRQALDSSRECYHQMVEEIGREGKESAETNRRLHAEARRAWQDRGHALPRAQQNTQRAQLEQKKVVASNALHVASVEEFMRREEENLVDGLHARKAAIREAGQRMRRTSQMARRISKEGNMREREATVESIRQRQTAGEKQLAQARSDEAARRLALHDSVSRRLSTGNLRDFKAQERERKAYVAAQLKAESLRNRKQYEQTVRADTERRRRLHDGVRKAETDGFGDTRVFAYSSVMHSGTSLWSQADYSREEGGRRFRHDLPNPKSPSGRWLRSYANQVVGSRTSRSSPGHDSVVSI